MTTERSPGEWNLAVRQQAAVAHLGQLGLLSTDVDEVLHEALIVCADTLGCTDVALFELVAAEGVLRGRAGLHDGRTVSRRSVRKVVVPTGRGSLPGFTLVERATVVSPDLPADDRFQIRAPEYGLPVRAAIAAPIGWEAEAFGVLAIYDLEVRTWTDDEVHFVQAVANTIGLAIRRHQVERDLRDSTARLDLSLSAGGLGAWSWHLDGDRVHLSAAALEIYGIAPEAFTGQGESFFAIIHPDDRDRFRADVIEAVRSGTDPHHLVRIIRPDTGELRWVESWGRQLDADDRSVHLVGVCADATERRRAEQVREQILEREHAARLEAEAARERLAFLAGASAVLGSSLDPDITLDNLADLCVPELADVCFIDLLDDEDALVERAARASSEARLHHARLLRKRRQELGVEAPTATGHLEALGGRAVLYPYITDELMEAAAADADHLALFRRLDARSTVLAPMVTRGRAIGVLTLVRTGGRRPFGDDDVAFVEELAARAALGVDNGRLFHSRNRVARSLQAALLPPAMPEIPGLALAARYEVAEADVEIGGDFYDVIPVGEGEWGLVVGDVCGRGPDAAALTGLVRHSVRSAVLRERAPSRVLGLTNQAVLQQIDDARFCTAAYLRVEGGEQGSVAVTAASAGHPRPIVVRAGGGAFPLECSGTLLGVVADPPLVDARVTLAPGDAVVLYTDGVTEARQGRELFGEARLIDALAEVAGAPAEEMAAHLESTVSAFRRSARDDTAILVAQALGPA